MKPPSKQPVPEPSLLLSLHDVSPLTLPACEQALAMLTEVGVPADALTVLAIPYHEEQVSLDRHAPTIRFLRTLEDQGACLVMHGLTHRLRRRYWSPAGLAKAHVFARGQGELFGTDAAETTRRLDEGQAILQRAGLANATRGFVPPAWLLSPAARRVVAERGFAFYEVFRGLVAGDAVLAPTVIGWGSLNAVEAVATAVYAKIQTGRARGDTRVAIHPADMARPSQKRAVRSAIARLLERMKPANYWTYLSDRG